MHCFRSARSLGWAKTNLNPSISMMTIAAHTFACSVCGASAGRVQVGPGEALVWSMCNTGTAISARAQKRLITALVAGEARQVYAVDPELAPFFCPRCKACYCSEHWKQRDIFEEDGFFDCVLGICPRGHERILCD
jgi:hypothetical protein